MEDELKWKLSEGRRFKRERSALGFIPLKQLKKASDHIHYKGEASVHNLRFRLCDESIDIVMQNHQYIDI